MADNGKNGKTPPRNARSRARAKRPGRGALMLLAGLLIGSALVRMGNDAGRAFAKADSADAMSEAPPVANDAAATPTEGPPESPHGANQSCASDPDIAATLDAFQAREARLKQREAELMTRMQALSVADQEISRQMTALTKAEDDLRATLALADSAAENDLARLTSVYESMKSKDAAALFEQMDPGFSAGFLGRMRPEAAANIMAGLDPQTAYTISAILAGRNADVPTQ